MIVEGEDPSYRQLTVGFAIRDAVRRRLEGDEKERKTGAARAAAGSSPAAAALRAAEDLSTRLAKGAPSILSSLDMSRKVPKESFVTEIEKWQGKLNLAQRKAAAKGISTVLLFEGADAAGTRRVVGALDARDVQVIPIASPNDEERAHHYLWRFWRHLSRAGRVTVFDRSWYGRVLVERVEGFATEQEWMRAYAEINQFEDQLVGHGIALAKFWLHVTPDEQLRRFKDRQKTPHKRWKITDEDWRNRKKWPDYERAVNDMVARTSTRVAPWTLVEANDKGYARIKVLRTVSERIEEALRG
jgi:polyphosphate kinase 2 (PPK2 family)